MGDVPFFPWLCNASLFSTNNVPCSLHSSPALYSWCLRKCWIPQFLSEVSYQHCEKVKENEWLLNKTSYGVGLLIQRNMIIVLEQWHKGWERNLLVIKKWYGGGRNLTRRGGNQKLPPPRSTWEIDQQYKKSRTNYFYRTAPLCERMWRRKMPTHQLLNCLRDDDWCSATSLLRASLTSCTMEAVLTLPYDCRQIWMEICLRTVPIDYAVFCHF